jgi:electron transfer flavoprotein alpha subunit
MSVLVLVECTDGQVKKSSLETASYASQVAALLGTTAQAVAIGSVAESALQHLGRQGIGQVWWLNDNRLQDFVAGAYVKAIAQAAAQTQARVLVLPGSNIGSAVGARLAVHLDAGLVTQVVSLPTVDGDTFTVRRGVFSGKAFAEVALSGDTKILSVKKNAFEVTDQEGLAQVQPLTVELQAEDLVGAPQETVRATGEVLLTEADIVVSGGRGMRGPENWHLIENLAKALGAATACSKPVSDAGWRPHHEHVGQTGITISPNLYIAAGISGAIQHLAGVNSSKVIVVINKDPEAPFFKAADYGIVGDVTEVLPKLTEAAKALHQ